MVIRKGSARPCQDVLVAGRTVSLAVAHGAAADGRPQAGAGGGLRGCGEICARSVIICGWQCGHQPSEAGGYNVYELFEVPQT